MPSLFLYLFPLLCLLSTGPVPEAEKTVSLCCISSRFDPLIFHNASITSDVIYGWPFTKGASMALKDDINTAASAGKRLKSGQQERESHSLKEMIEADRYLANRDLVTGNARKIVINKLRPPGTS